MMARAIEAIDLFCGIGGLSYGVMKSGIHIVAGLDSDPTCKYSFTQNVSQNFLKEDISRFDFSKLNELYSPDAFRILVGCAPCQPFSSHSNKRRGEVKSDKRWGLLGYFGKAIESVRPDIVSMENVPGLAKTSIFREFETFLKESGYYIDYGVAYCPDYGVPQNRKRLVLVASRLGQIKRPNPTVNKNCYKTVKDTIGKLNPISAGSVDEEDPLHRSPYLTPINQKRIRQSIPGGTWRDWDESILPNCFKKSTGASYSGVYGRMDWNKVSPTITTKFTNYGSGRFGHPEQNRALSIKEGALLQSFPDSFKFDSTLSPGILSRQIGNAVPPLLGEAIGKTIVEHIRDVTGR